MSKVRSPCPGLNSAANHGFINHNGKNLTIPALITGLKAALGIGADFTTAIGAAGLLSSPNPLLGSFNLDDLDKHNFPIEHDASLSRADAFFGNDHSFNSTYFDMFLSNFGNAATTNITSASKAKYSRVLNSRAVDPTFTYGPREYLLSYGESALYLQTMASSPTSANAPLAYVEDFFENERLPYALGWRPSTTPITLLSLANMISQLIEANGADALPEGLSVAANTYKGESARLSLIFEMSLMIIRCVGRHRSDYWPARKLDPV